MRVPFEFYAFAMCDDNRPSVLRNASHLAHKWRYFIVFVFNVMFANLLFSFVWPIWSTNNGRNNANSLNEWKLFAILLKVFSINFKKIQFTAFVCAVQCEPKNKKNSSANKVSNKSDDHKTAMSILFFSTRTHAALFDLRFEFVSSFQPNYLFIFGLPNCLPLTKPLYTFSRFSSLT